MEENLVVGWNALVWWMQKAEMEQRAIGLLRSDPQMRTAFINQVAAPIANKLFECGMIP